MKNLGFAGSVAAASVISAQMHLLGSLFDKGGINNGVIGVAFQTEEGVRYKVAVSKGPKHITMTIQVLKQSFILYSWKRRI